MRYEFTIALRYLISKQSVREPTVIGMLTVAGLAISTAMMIIVLAVFAGFEGDLRDKILGTHAHILVTGPDEDPLENPGPVLEQIQKQPRVVGASAFVESEVMVASTTGYSGMLLRGLQQENERPSGDFSRYLVEGDIAWLRDSKKSLDYRQENWGYNGAYPTLDDIDDLERQIDEAQRKIEQLKGGVILPDEDEDDNDWPKLPGMRTARVDDGIAPDDAMMPALPAPSNNQDADDTSDMAMPALPLPQVGAEPSLPTLDDVTGMPALPSARSHEPDDAVDAVRQDRDLPGVLIGTKMQETLNVLIGDTINLVTPDGDLGPNGLIPRSRPFRVVGVFYTGFYLYDSNMGVVNIDDARALLNIPDHEVTGIEVQTDDLENAHRVATAIDVMLHKSDDTSQFEVRDWRTLNQSLFVALKIERVAMAAVLIFFIAISGLLVLLVVWMFVIEKRQEIAILKAIGATKMTIMRLFLSQGLLMGLVGAGLGLILALGFVGIAVYVGIPLNPDDYYIDRLPIETNAWEFVLVTLSALVVTVIATLVPALQAARLEPVTGLRDDQDNL